MNETSVIIESFQNNNCSGPEQFTLTYSTGICKNSMIITPTLPKNTAKKENWNEYIVLTGSNFASNQKRNIIKSIKISKKVLLTEEIIKYIDFSQFSLSEFLFTVSSFLFTFTFFILLAQ